MDDPPWIPATVAPSESIRDLDCEVAHDVRGLDAWSAASAWAASLLAIEGLPISSVPWRGTWPGWWLGLTTDLMELVKEGGTVFKVHMEPVCTNRNSHCLIFCLYQYRCILYLVSSMSCTVSSSYLPNIAPWNSFSFFNLLSSHLILPFSFSLLSSSSVSWVRTILAYLLIIHDEWEVTLKGVLPVACFSSFPETSLSAWGTQVDSAASRARLLSVIKGRLSTCEGYWEIMPTEVLIWGMRVALSDINVIEVASMG